MAVNCNLHEACNRGGTSSTDWKRAPALETPKTAATSKAQTQGGVSEGAMGSRSIFCLQIVHRLWSTDDAGALEQQVNGGTNDHVDED